MRVLVVASTFPRWPQDVVPPFVYDLSQRLANKGHEIHVVAPHTWGAKDDELIGQLRVHRFHYAPSGHESLAYGAGVLENLRADRRRWALVPPFLTSELAATVTAARRYRIDLIHAHWLIPQGLVAAAARRVIKRPVLMTAHGGDVFAMSHGQRRALLRFAARSADHCTVNSTATQDALMRATGVTASVIPMGVDLAEFSRKDGEAARSDDANGTRRILFVGRLAEKKGIIHLIDAMPLITLSVPNAVLQVVGNGPQEAALRTRANQLGLGNAVEFVGAIAHDDLPQFYRTADVFVAPSIVASSGDTEGLGVVLLEAAASGTAIVASNVGGIADVVRDGETGLLAEPGKPESIASAVVRALEDKTLSEVVSAAARKQVVERFSWDSVANQFDALYRSLAESSV